MAFALTGYGIGSLPIAAAPLAGSPPILSAAYTLDASYGSYALTGQSITITRGFLLSPQNGLYSLTGQAVDIAYTPAPPVVGPTQYFIEIRSFTQSRRI